MQLKIIFSEGKLRFSNEEDHAFYSYLNNLNLSRVRIRVAKMRKNSKCINFVFNAGCNYVES